METLQKDRASQLEIIRKLKDEIRNLSAQLANVQFNFRDPVKSFDRSKVKGVVAKLIKVKDSSTMTALEVTVGGKLFNVVVDTGNTRKQLLEKGGLQRRVTIIPLNKIQPNTVPPRVQKSAVRLVGKENAQLALSLVGYSEELKVIDEENGSVRSSSFSSSEVINLRNEAEIYSSESQFGVSPIELDRTLHELLEARQHEQIKEL